MFKSNVTLELPEVTLVCISGVNVSNSIYALWRSSRHINFASVKLISNLRPSFLPSGISFETAIGTQLDSIDEYNRYVIYSLWRHVETSHCLIVQADGYVLNPKRWQSRFLEYDYIGAPWPIRENAYIDPFGQHQRVGNGGFSLRSKRLLEVPKKTEVPWEVNSGSFYRHEDAGLYSEDGNVCVHNRHIYEAAGCIWPELPIAIAFSVEKRVDEFQGTPTFGFHKRLPSLRYKALELFAKLRFTWEIRVLPLIPERLFLGGLRRKKL
jgi:hypothetical protein